MLLPEKCGISLFATKMSCCQRCRGVTSPCFNNTYCSLGGGFLYSEENTIKSESKKGAKIFLFGRVPVVKQQKGISHRNNY